MNQWTSILASFITMSSPFLTISALQQQLFSTTSPALPDALPPPPSPPSKPPPPPSLSSPITVLSIGLFGIKRIPLIIRHFCLPIPTNLSGIAQSSLSFEFINDVNEGAAPQLIPTSSLWGHHYSCSALLEGGTMSPGNGNDCGYFPP